MARPKKSSAAKIKSYHFTFGTPNEPSEPRSYVAEGSMRDAMVEKLEEWRPFARRYDHAGVGRINTAVERLRMCTVRGWRWSPSTPEPDHVDCLIDEHTDTILRLRYWKD